jgi:hypothetical protein
MATRKQSSVLRKNSSKKDLKAEPWFDEILEEVYAAKDKYAAEHGYDLDRIYADLKRREAASNLRPMPPEPKTRP